jgi:hypothetical protein
MMSMKEKSLESPLMKRFLILLVAFLAVGAVNAQKTVKIDQSVSQARKADVATPVYVMPIIAELKVDEAKGRVKDVWRFTGDFVSYLDNKGHLPDRIYEDLRRESLFKSAEKYQCDVIVAPTYNVHVTESAAEVTVVGYTANFVNWKTGTAADYNWIKFELNQRIDKDDTTKGEKLR